MILADKELLKAVARRSHCELCGARRSSFLLDPAHLMSRGAGRVDLPCNLAGLCRWCHNETHANPEAKERLWAVVCRREGLIREQIQAEVYRVRLLAKGSVYEPHVSSGIPAKKPGSLLPLQEADFLYTRVRDHLP